MPAKQVVVVRTTTKKTRTRKASSGKKGNQNRCSKCGRYM